MKEASKMAQDKALEAYSSLITKSLVECSRMIFFKGKAYSSQANKKKLKATGWMERCQTI